VDDAWFLLSVGSIHKEQIQEARAQAARAKAEQEQADRNAERQDRIDRQNQQNVYHNGNQQTTYKTRPYSSTYTTSSKTYIRHDVDDRYTPSYNTPATRKSGYNQFTPSHPLPSAPLDHQSTPTTTYERPPAFNPNYRPGHRDLEDLVDLETKPLN
jgi:hypothetical protein